MARVRPHHAVLLFAFLFAAVLLGSRLLQGRAGASRYEQVSPDRSGQVRIGVADLQPVQVRFYRFLNPGNQEVKFFVGRDEQGVVQVAFDAAESDFRRKRGFRHEGGWMVNNKCESTCRLSEVNDDRGGCRPVALAHRLEGTDLVLQEADILKGWRYFR
ncbi:MAG TPA: Fe-S-containing protein [Thermoanaerobaculia bacterium]|nr:Fe-S-containing protein [Thermoanaerobaculia bacterium]